MDGGRDIPATSVLHQQCQQHQQQQQQHNRGGVQLNAVTAAFRLPARPVSQGLDISATDGLGKKKVIISVCMQNVLEGVVCV